jgi:hypothetical protein
VRVILNYGMGVESTAILARWVFEPDSRDFDWPDLTVLSAQTGDEWPDTRVNVETHILPLLKERNVRYVQLARARGVKGDVAVLSDTRAPDRLYTEGRFKLSDELLAAGTVFTASGDKKCSQKGKGEVNDWWLKRDVTGPFRQVMGFNADEVGRVARDSCYGGSNRNAEYPLMTWGWNREKCEEYLFEKFGVVWGKSACAHCPFSRGQSYVIERFSRHPEQAAHALYLEHLALALNPLVGLYADKHLRSLLTVDAERHAEAWLLYAKRLAATPWALYRVRRAFGEQKPVDPNKPMSPNQLAKRRAAEHRAALAGTTFKPKPPKPRKPNSARSVEHLAVGTMAEMAELLRRRADEQGTALVEEPAGFPPSLPPPA